MTPDDEVFRTALAGKSIPILTLDHQWHKLFTQTGDNPQLHVLEEELNELLRKQGRLNTDIKSLNIYKKKCMNSIVSIMELKDSPAKDKQMEDNKKAIEETNEKLDALRDELLDLPHQIDEKNFELMMETMRVCYAKIQKNLSDINAINAWIEKFRTELKKNTLKKQQKEIWNNELYSYMHAVFGSEVIEVFDLKYNPNNVLNKNTDNISAEKDSPEQNTK